MVAHALNAGRMVQVTTRVPQIDTQRPQRTVITSAKCHTPITQCAFSSSSSGVTSRANISLSRTPCLVPLRKSGYSRPARSRSTTRVFAEITDEVLESAARKVKAAGKSFQRVGTFAFWTQLILTTISAVIVVFSIFYRSASRLNTEIGLYLNLFGAAVGLVSVVWAIGYRRLGKSLLQSVNDPGAAPSRSAVLQRINSGITINMTGLFATLIGLESTCGLLFAKSLSFTAANPFAVGGASTAPVLALDIFVVQASANVIFSHFLGLACSLYLLKALTKEDASASPSPPASPTKA
mmetsp:Transcript_24079/g.29160  ORF Transcript_24079/g.29160 Transcript_24079/m.29160 type:complete len:295 (-) Transcript_24079:119-1003(-)